MLLSSVRDVNCSVASCGASTSHRALCYHDDNRHINWDSVKFLLLFCTFTAVTTAELLLRKATTTIYMKNYVVFLNLVMVVVSCVVFFALMLYNKIFSPDGAGLLNRYDFNG